MAVYNIVESDGGYGYELVPIGQDLKDLEVIMENVEMSDEDILAFNDDPKRFLLNRDCWSLLCEETEREWCERTGEKTTEMYLEAGYHWKEIPR